MENFIVISEFYLFITFLTCRKGGQILGISFRKQCTRKIFYWRFSPEVFHGIFEISCQVDIGDLDRFEIFKYR